MRQGIVTMEPSVFLSIANIQSVSVSNGIYTGIHATESETRVNECDLAFAQDPTSHYAAFTSWANGLSAAIPGLGIVMTWLCTALG